MAAPFVGGVEIVEKAVTMKNSSGPKVNSLKNRFRRGIGIS